MSSNVARIKVIGVGGGGGNAVSYMTKSELEGVDFCVLNTDRQALDQFENIENKLALGNALTKGLGAGANPSIGKEAAECDIEQIKSFMEETDLVFITAGLGGGTGTGAAPVVAKCAKELGILTIAVVTKPFPFEGKNRVEIANQGLEDLRKEVDSLIVIPNENLLQYLGANTKLVDAFNEANNVLLKAVRGVSELITKPGLINIDFADLKTVMMNSGYSMMGIGNADGANRATKATKAALNSPLLDNLEVKGAKGLLVNVAASDNITIGDFHAVGDLINSYADPDSTTVIGTTINPELGESIQVTIVATGLLEKENVDIDCVADDEEINVSEIFKEIQTEPKNESSLPGSSKKSSFTSKLKIPGFFKLK